MRRILAILILGALSSTGNIAFGLEVGVGVADITPDVQAYKVPMAGYGARLGRTATGVHDPLHAKVLFLRDGAVQMALITCDLRSITPEFKNQIVEKSASLGFTGDNVFIAASHTHDGPSMYPEKFWQLQFGAYDPRIVDVMSTSVAAAVKEAVAAAQTASIGFGEGRADGFTHNRRWEYDAAGEKPVVDPVVWVLRVDTSEMKPAALLVNFATHPTILGADNMQISAEWPGALQGELERAFPGVVALYTNGAEGDQAPDGGKGETDFDKMTDFGARLGRLVADIARGIETKPDVTIGFKRVKADLPELTFPESAAKKYASYLEAAKTSLPRAAEIQAFRIGRTALVGLPGEPIMAVGHAVQDRVNGQGYDKAVVVGLANDYIGYIVNEREYAHGGYEVESRSYYGAGLGAFIAEQAANVVRELK